MNKKDGTAHVTGLVATSPTKSGALNLILQRAKERRAAAKQPMVISESTADLVLNMEETATENQPVVDEKVIHSRNFYLRFFCFQKRIPNFIMLNVSFSCPFFFSFLNSGNEDGSAR